MKLLFIALALAAAAAIGVGVLLGDESGSARAVSPVFAVVRGEPPALVELDPRSLNRRPDRTISLEEGSDCPVLSPDGSRMVVAGQSLRFIDVGRMEVVGQMPIPIDVRGDLCPIAWPVARRLFAVAPDREAVVVDPTARRIVRRTPLDDVLLVSAATGGLLVHLSAQQRPIGPAWLSIFGADRVGSVRLNRISAGSEWIEGTDVLRERYPGLAVDENGRRAFVVGAGEPVAEVDLSTLRVTYHELASKRSLLGRLGNWLLPEAHAKAASGPWREAAWVADGVLAVWGRDEQVSTELPAGLRLIDTNDWTVRVVDPRATRVFVGDGVLLASSTRWLGGRGTWVGNGLKAYDATGSRLFHVLQGRPVEDVQFAGRYAYARVAGGDAVIVLDLAKGRLVRIVAWNAEDVLVTRGR